MNIQFHEHVTSGVFNLTLTKNHIQALGAVYCGQRSKVNFGRGPNALRGLTERGLIQCLWDRLGDEGVKELANKEGFLYSGEWSIVQPFYRMHWLTKAGELTCQLLMEAGLLEPDLQRAPIIAKPWKVQTPAWREEHFFKTFTEALNG